MRKLLLQIDDEFMTYCWLHPHMMSGVNWRLNNLKVELKFSKLFRFYLDFKASVEGTDKDHKDLNRMVIELTVCLLLP